MEASKLLQVVAGWVRTNCPCAEVGRDLVKHVREAERDQVSCSFMIGSALTKAGKPYLVHCYSDQLFAFPLAASQAKELDLHPTRLRYVPHLRKVAPTAECPTVVTLDELEIRNAASLSCGEPIEGRCTYSMHGIWAGMFALGLQLEFGVHASTMQWDTRTNGLFQPDGALHFSFSPIRPTDRQAPDIWVGIRVAVLRLYGVPDPSTTEGRPPFSNACAALVDLS